MPEAYYIGLALVLGFSLGSFLNVVIYRLPRGESIVSPPSHCPQCDTPIRWWQNIPVVSYLVLGGRCAYCQSHISLRYPIVELCTGLLFVAGYRNFGLTLDVIHAWIFILFMLAIALIDWDHFLIPDFLSYPGIVAGLLITGLYGNGYLMLEAVIGGIVGVAVTGILRWMGQALFKKESLGLGDIKLAAVIGIFLGWDRMLLSIFLGAVLVLLVSLGLVLGRKKVLSRRFPFGFYFGWAAILALFWGDNLIHLYLNFVFYP